MTGPGDNSRARSQPLSDSTPIESAHNANKFPFDPAAYEILLSPLSEDDGGGFFARIPALPGCMGDGETELEAIEDVRKAALEWMASAIEFGNRVPPPRESEWSPLGNRK